jgi:hypothetical protein
VKTARPIAGERADVFADSNVIEPSAPFHDAGETDTSFVAHAGME